jgi:hypothetical protein
MFSNMQIAFATGGKLHGAGVLAPGRGRVKDDYSISIVPNNSKHDFEVTSLGGDDDPVGCRAFVIEALERSRVLTTKNAECRDHLRAFNGLRPYKTPARTKLAPGETHFPVGKPAGPMPRKKALFETTPEISAGFKKHRQDQIQGPAHHVAEPRHKEDRTIQHWQRQGRTASLHEHEPPVINVPIAMMERKLVGKVIEPEALSIKHKPAQPEMVAKVEREAPKSPNDTKIKPQLDIEPEGPTLVSSEANADPEPVAVGEEEQSLSIPPGGASRLTPNLADINAHLYSLFPPAFVQAYPDSQIEIAYGHPSIKEGAVNKARIFSAFDLKGAADFAYKQNVTGNNVYVGVALRSTSHKFGRAGQDDVITARFAWAEYDQPGDAERVHGVCRANNLLPANVVRTGSTPCQRDHLYFGIDGVATPQDLSEINSGLMKLLGTDAVFDPSRVLRLAGTVNYPKFAKLAIGYVPELTTLRLLPDSPRYSIATLSGLGVINSSGASHDHTNGYGDTFDRKARADDQIVDLLEATRTPQSWHNSMRDAVASMIGRGWSDLQIRLTCAQYCNGGSNDADLAELIKGGRKKWDKPDGGEQDLTVPTNLKEGNERIANQAPVSSELPVIRITPRISLLTTRTQQMLINARVPFYQRGGELVRPIIRTVKAAHGRLTKTALLKLITPVFMRDTMCRHSHWERCNPTTLEWLKTTAPMNVALTLLARDGVWGFPEIVGIIATPTMRPDGSLLLKQGYDPATRLLLIEPPKMPEIPDQPTREDALKALALLEDLISESPFDDEASRAVALSGLITPVVRGAFPVAPMHVSSAPVAGSGKSFLWDLVAAISAGQQRMPVMAAGNEEETMKRLAGVLLTGQPLISIDNVNGELKGDLLCQAIEQHILDVRPLGRSDIIRIETGGVTIFATGNNITIVGDLCRRTITSRLDAKLENPQLKPYRNDPIRTILDDRGTYIAAGLTICRAYIVAGRPGLLPRLASFEGWSDTVRSALVWLGKSDAIDTMQSIRDEDPQRVALSDLLHAWSQDQGVGAGTSVPLAVIIDKSVATEKLGGIETGEFKYPDLNAAVRAATSLIAGPTMGAKCDPARFGQYCKAMKGRIVDELRLVNRPSTRGGAATWWVERVRPPEQAAG